MSSGGRPALRKTRDIIGLPVVCLGEGRVVGHVRQIVFDPDAGTVVGMIVSTGGILSPGRLLALSEVHSVGDDAVTIQTTASLLGPARATRMRDLQSLNDRRPLYGMHVITDGGTALGRVDDILVDFGTGKICEFVLSEGLFADIFRGRTSLPASSVKMVGNDAIVVHEHEYPGQNATVEPAPGPPDSAGTPVGAAPPEPQPRQQGPVPAPAQPAAHPRPAAWRQRRLKVFHQRPVPPGLRRR